MMSWRSVSILAAHDRFTPSENTDQDSGDSSHYELLSALPYWRVININ